jgi:multiple sugar transport system permease protein
LNREAKKVLVAMAFISPWLIGFLVFQLYPVAASIYYSFCHYDVINPPVFVGLANYKNLMADETFIHSLKATFLYAALALPLGLFASLFFALLLNRKIKARGVLRTIYYIPSLVPMVALAILWGWIFKGENGVLNYILGLIGIDGPNWLGSTRWATPAIVLTGVWGVGASIVIYLAALQNVPVQLYEAADIDGAGWWHKTIHVTLPSISSVIYFNLMMGVIGCMQVFAVPYVMTGGGPERSTYYYTLYLFDQAFKFLHMGYASAMAMVLAVMIIALTWITHKLASKKVHYAE